MCNVSEFMVWPEITWRQYVSQTEGTMGRVKWLLDIFLRGHCTSIRNPRVKAIDQISRRPFSCHDDARPSVSLYPWEGSNLRRHGRSNSVYVCPWSPWWPEWFRPWWTIGHEYNPRQVCFKLGHQGPLGHTGHISQLLCVMEPLSWSLERHRVSLSKKRC